MYSEDASMSLRNSVDNPEVNRVYAEFYGKPLGELPEKLLHTSYQAKNPSMTVDSGNRGSW